MCSLNIWFTKSEKYGSAVTIFTLTPLFLWCVYFDFTEQETFYLKKSWKNKS